MSVCPYLYVDPDTRKYMCRVLGREVNPFLQPCLSNFVECPAYARVSKEGLPEKVAEAKPEEKVEEATPRVEFPPTSTPADLLLRTISEVEERIRRADEMWRNYAEHIVSTMSNWLRIKQDIERELRKVERLLEFYLQKLEELNVRKTLGLIRLPGEEADELLRRYEEKVSKLSRVREDLVSKLREIESRLQDHRKRIHAILLRPDIAKFKLALTKLEELRNVGKVDEQTYEKIRSEIMYLIPE
ncbi:MAG: hypothetical protein DRJ40_10585 [Thermoprotei archaeon]|nr:MAG: hypothetical protein DRJ40_10585 [Thermoprotei archaeon]